MDGDNPSSNLEPLIDPNNLSENDNETPEQQSDLFPVTVKIENEEEEKKDELRVQVFNLFCYECDTAFSNAKTFAQHNHRLTSSSSSVQVNKENVVGSSFNVKAKRRYKTRRIRSSITILREVIKNAVAKTTTADYEDENHCLVGDDKILVECKKCMKNFKSLSEFLKHLGQKNVDKENHKINMINHPASPGQRQEKQPLGSLLKPEVKDEELTISQKHAPSPAEDFDADDGDNGNDEDDEWISTSVQNHNESSQKSPQGLENIGEAEGGSHSKASQVFQNEENENEKLANSTVIPSKKKKKERPRKPKYIPKRPVRIYPCCHCDLTFPRLRQLREHKRTHKLRKGRTFMCHLCSEIFRTTIHLGKHIALIHESDVISNQKACPVCFQVFPNDSELVAHSVVHRDVRPFLCPEPDCKYAKIGFRSRPNLRSHVVSVHNKDEAVYPCEKCHKIYNTKLLLKCHMKIHAEGRDRKFVCDFPGCEKSFFNSYNVVLHKKTHAVDLPLFHCSFCQKGFKSKTSLTTHIRSVHENIREHVCETCGKGFQKPYVLKVHQRTHTGVRLFPCLVCPDKAYTTKQQLINHNLRCHPPEPPDQVESSQQSLQQQEQNLHHHHVSDMNYNQMS